MVVPRSKLQNLHIPTFYPAIYDTTTIKIFFRPTYQPALLVLPPGTERYLANSYIDTLKTYVDLAAEMK